ncbi:MAG: HAMP domain-containing sensor histidine kinase [Campylobacterota bacterium]|nr:HAMP domain-containing sensor histidine kinase [Campylobacterota bacterium]
MRFKSLKTQVLVWFGGITTILLIIFNITFYKFLEENIKLSIQNKLYNKAVFINDKLKTGIHIKELLKDKKVESFEIAIIKDEKIIFKKGDANFKKLATYTKDKKTFFVFTQGDSLNGLFIFKIYEPFKGAILFYERDIDKEINSKLDEVKNSLFVLEPILLLFLIFAASKLIDKILKPIKNITKTANTISVTDLSQSIIQPTSDDEIKDLVDAFNKMIKRLDTEVEQIEQFNSDVSHELKTPLTVIKGEIEITLNKNRESDYYIRTLKTIDKESQQIQLIIDNLLMLTKYTKSNIQQTFETVSLDSLLLDTINHYNLQLKEKNIKLHLDKLESIDINANKQLISIIFSNLIDNAIKYSQNDKNIYISLEKKDKIYFIVKDEGIGISKKQLSKVMNRFYRVDESRNKKIKGFGLGLSLVKNSVELHEASIKIDSVKDEGTIVKIIL